MPRSPLTIPPLPAPLTWDVAPASSSLDPLTIAAPARCDLFHDPAGGAPETAAPRLLGPVEGDFQFSARVRCEFGGAYDAGALLLWAGDARWVKLAFEVSPQGEAGVVSVITDGLSDDANAFAVAGDAVWLRISRPGRRSRCTAGSTASRGASSATSRSRPPELRAGFLAQSPTGEGTTARFDEIGFTPERLADLRSGV